MLPVLIKAGAVIAGWFYASGLVTHLELGHRAAMHAAPGRWAIGVAINLIGVALVIGLWKMKRAALVGLLALALVNAALMLIAGRATHPIAVAALRVVPLVPAIVGWTRLA